MCELPSKNFPVWGRTARALVCLNSIADHDDCDCEDSLLKDCTFIH